MIITTAFVDVVLDGIRGKVFQEEINIPKDHINYEKTVAAIKWIIDQGVDRDNNITLEFNNDYTKVLIREDRKWTNKMNPE